MQRVIATLLLSLPFVSTSRAQSLDLAVPPSSEAPVVVHAGFELYDVNEVDEESQTFEFEGTLSLNWHDPRLAFDPVETRVSEIVYKGDYQFTEIFDGWWPQLVLMNRSRALNRQGVVLRIAPDGTVWYVEEIDAVAESPMDLRRFPFDRQSLEIRFSVLGYGVEEVQLKASERLSGLRGEEGGPIRHAEWQFDRVSVEAVTEATVVAGPSGVGQGSTLKASVSATRSPGSVLRGVVAPLMLFVILSWSVFWMDSESLGDRMDISFIGLLTVVAFQLVVEGKMPDIPYLTVVGAFLLINYVLLAATIVVNLRVGYLDRHGRRSDGDIIDRRCRWIFPLLYLVGMPLGLLLFGILS